MPQDAVVVGVMGGDLDDTCLAWAAGAAQRTGRPLHLVHAREDVMSASSLVSFSGIEPALIGGFAFSDFLDPSQALEQDSVLMEILAGARQRWPDLDITGSGPIGRRERVLVEASEDAYMIIVGAPKRRGLQRFLERPSMAVAMHAACPVVIIVPAGVRVEPQGPVIAAVDGSEHSRYALERAFIVARTRGERLVVVTTWAIEVLDGAVLTTYGTDAWTAVEEGHRAMVQSMIDPLAAQYPDVEIEVRVIRGHPAHVITELSDEAGLLVLGSRGRGGFRGMLLGSVTHEVIETATCPVLIARNTEHR